MFKSINTCVCILRKMIKSSVYIFLYITLTVCFCTAKSRYDHYRLYRVHLEQVEHFDLLRNFERVCSGYTFFGLATKLGDTIPLMVPAHEIAYFTRLLDRHGIEADVLIGNIQKNIDDEAQHIMTPLSFNANEIDWHHYYHLESINKWLDLLINQYDYITALNIGKSYENRDIRGIKFSKKSGNTGIFVEGGIHGREWISPAVTTFILNQLIHSTDPSIIFLADNFDWYLFPVVNPDGYVYSFESDRLWRKSRQPYGICLGVDLNRNFDANWVGPPNRRAASCTANYPGPTKASEPETQVLKNFLQSNVQSGKIRTYFAMHSFGQYVAFPFAQSDEHVSNHDDLKMFGENAVAAMNRLYGSVYKTGQSYKIIYPSSGTTMDYVYSKLNISIAYTFELRGPPNSTDMFLLPVNEIEPCGWETLAAFKSIVTNAYNKGYYN